MVLIVSHLNGKETTLRCFVYWQNVDVFSVIILQSNLSFYFVPLKYDKEN